MLKSCRVVTVVALYFLAATSYADLVFYTDRAAFQAASGTLTTESLDDFTEGGNVTVQPTGVTLTGIGTADFFEETVANFISEGTSSLRTNFWDAGAMITFTFATPITAFGADFVDDLFGIFHSPAFDMTFSVPGGALNRTSNQPQTASTPLFFGVRDTMGSFSEVKIATNASNGVVNFDFIQFQSVPESSALLYGGAVAALTACCYWVRRKFNSLS
jgi:hypothetical protein